MVRDLLPLYLYDKRSFKTDKDVNKFPVWNEVGNKSKIK